MVGLPLEGLGFLSLDQIENIGPSVGSYSSIDHDSKLIKTL